MRIELCDNKKTLGERADGRAAQLIGDAFDSKGSAHIIAATAASN